MKLPIVLLSLMLLLSCSSDAPTSAVRIEIEPSNALLQAGDSRELEVVGYDENDKRVAVDATWTSDLPTVVSVANGTVSAEQALGSATIEAKVGDLTSAAFVYIAEPVNGAVLYSDDQVTSEPVGVSSGAALYSYDQDTSEPVGATGDGALVGSLFEIGLQQTVAYIGDILIPTGDTPGMGRIVGVDGETFTVEIIPINEAFLNLDVTQELEIEYSQEELDALTGLPDGTSAHEGLECSFDATATVMPSFPTVTARPIVKWDGAFRIRNGSIERARLATRVGAIIEAEGNFELPALFTGGFDCEYILWHLPVEGVGGPLSFFVRPTIPFGFGLSSAATIRADAFRVEVGGNSAPKAAFGATVTSGVEWTPSGGLKPVFDKASVNDVKVELKLAGTGSILDNLRYLLEARIFATSGVDFTPRIKFSDDSDFQFLDFDAGFLQKADFGSLEAQASNDGYASNYDLEAFVRAEAGNDIKDVLKYVGITQDPPSFEASSDRLFTSPTGSLGVPSGIVELDTEVPLQVTLQNTGYLGIHNVYAVRVWRQIGTGPWEMIAEELEPPEDKTNFTFSWTPSAPEFADGDVVHLLPTVETEFMPLVNLELAADAVRPVNIVVPNTDAPVLFMSDRDGDTEIYSVTTNGGGLTNLTQNSAGNDFNPKLSPDGNKILFQTNRDGDFEIYSMDLDGSNQTNLTGSNVGSDFNADWSFDGSKIVFQSNRDGNTEIYSMNADGSNQTNLSNNAEDDIAPYWSPDASQVLFVSFRDGNPQVYVMNSDGTGQSNLSSNANVDLEPSWSPDGTKIVFLSNRTGDQEVFVMDANGANQTNLTQSASSSEALFAPAWSPDGLKILFQSDRDGDTEIYVMDSDGSNPTRLTNAAGFDGGALWSPDGLTISFESSRDGNTEIYVMASDGSNQVDVSNDSATDFRTGG